MIKENYEIMIAGKLRIFKSVCFTPSRSGIGEVIANSEFKRLSFIVCKEICFSEDLLILEELEFLRNLFDLTQNEVALAISVNESTFSKWKKNKKDSGFNLMESSFIKSFFKKKLIETAQRDKVSNQFMVDAFLHEMSSNLNEENSIYEKMQKIESTFINTFISSRFETILATKDIDIIVSNSKKKIFNTSAYYVKTVVKKSKHAEKSTKVIDEYGYLKNLAIAN